MLQFKKVIVHNFGSYNHAEVDLQSRGFCLVSGENNFKKDNALSNGSGKSFLWSAICYAITGETVAGLHTNLKNILVDENVCYTTVEFLNDADRYIVTRTIAPKSDLKIIKNGVDVSGKGIRESEKKLGELLPDLNKDLLTSTIIIGQGMPCRFSSYSPSGRKELLEKLTKSDFMIEDIKNRVAARQEELNRKIREFEDSLIVHKTQLSGLQSQLIKERAELQAATEATNFDEQIEAANTQIALIQKDIDTVKDAVSALEEQLEHSQTELQALVEEKASVQKEELENYNAKRSELNVLKARLESQISAYKREIQRIQAITDICPTCKQRIPDVHKPSTDFQQSEIARLTEELSPILKQIGEADRKHGDYQYSINNEFDAKINTVRSASMTFKRDLATQKDFLSRHTTQLRVEQEKLSKLMYDKANYSKYVQGLTDRIEQTEREITKTENLITLTDTSRNDYLQHLAVIKKMDSLIKRDFRGYLLSNIIEYIDYKSKEYCETVFGTQELDIYLDGNALDISYCGKMFDGLSGGEKQRVDLILQFAIRDMLASYLGLSANIIVLDEITDFLDKKSCKAVMNLLEKELNTIESVFIISHHAEELELPIDSEMKIIKNTDGISEVAENAA